MSLTYKLSASQFMTFAVTAKTKLPQTHILYVTELRLIMSFGKTDAPDYDCWTRINWAEFDRVAALFPHFERLQLDFMLESDFMSFLMNERSHKAGMENLREKKRVSVKYRFHFGSQPFDWPMGAYMCKVCPSFVGKFVFTDSERTRCRLVLDLAGPRLPQSSCRTCASK